MHTRYVAFGALILALVCTISACGQPGPRQSEPSLQIESSPTLEQAQEGQSVELLTIEQNAVGMSDGWRIGVSNIWERTYTAADGISHTGITAQLTLWKEGTDPQDVTRLIVYPGALFPLGDRQLLVAEIRSLNGSGGRVVIDQQPVGR